MRRTVAMLLVVAKHDSPIVDAQLVDCDAARWVNDQRGNYLEFAAGRPFDGRYDGESPIPYGARVSVEPSINLQFFRVQT